MKRIAFAIAFVLIMGVAALVGRAIVREGEDRAPRLDGIDSSTRGDAKEITPAAPPKSAPSSLQTPLDPPSHGDMKTLEPAPAAHDAPPKMERVAQIIFSDMDLRSKLKAIAELPESERRDAERRLSKWLTDKGADRVGKELHSVLCSEDDPKRLESLANVLAGGARFCLTCDAEVLGILRNGQPAEKRLAAAWAAGPISDPFVPAEWTDWMTSVSASIRGETDPRVVRTLALVVYDRAENVGQVIDALRDAAIRSSASDVQEIAQTIAKGTLLADGGPKSFYDFYRSTPTGDVRNEVARGLATCCLKTDSCPLIRDDQDRQDFIALYRSTTILRVREDLVQAARSRMPEAATMATLAADLAAVEPDGALRARLQALAAKAQK